MATGQVGFKDQRALCFVDVEKRENAIINRLEKTRVEKETKFFIAEREAYDVACRKKEKEEKRAKADAEQKQKEDYKKQKEARSYDNLFKEVRNTRDTQTNKQTNNIFLHT